MGTTADPIKAQDITIEAVVIRKDGTREDLGVIARMEHPEPPPGLKKRIMDAIKKEGAR